jgi:hypothetical protein
MSRSSLLTSAAAISRPKALTAEPDSGSQDAAPPVAPVAPNTADTTKTASMTHADLMRRVALIHAAIDEYEMDALDAYAIRKRRNEKGHAS